MGREPDPPETVASTVTSPPDDERKANAGPRAGGLRHGFAALGHRNYRIFFFTQMFSLTGTWMQSLAQSWLVLTMTDSAFQLGLINVCQFGPMLFFGLFGGVVADRVPKRRLLLVSQSFAGAIAAVLAILVGTGAVELWHIYALALAFGVVNAFDMPARQAFVAEMVGKADLMNAVALNSALFNTSRIIGPALAGLLLATVGATICFVANALSYVPVLVGLAAMRIAATVPGRRQSGINQLKEGLAYVRTTPAVLLPILLVAVVATFGMNFNVWVPLLAKDEFGVGAGGFGVLMASMGIGSLTGALALAFKAKRPRRQVMMGMALVFGAGEIALAWAGAVPLHFAAGMAILVVTGFAMSIAMATANTFVQTNAPDALRGRVMSIYMTVFAGSTPIGALFAGATARAFGTPVSVLLGGAIVLLGTIAVGAAWNANPRWASHSSLVPRSLAAAPLPPPVRRPAPGP